MMTRIALAVLLACSIAYYAGYKQALRQRVQPGVMILAEPQHFPNAVRVYNSLFVAGYSLHCIVVDRETQTVRPFFENQSCSAEAVSYIHPPQIPDLTPRRDRPLVR